MKDFTTVICVIIVIVYIGRKFFNELRAYLKNSLLIDEQRRIEEIDRNYQKELERRQEINKNKEEDYYMKK